MKTTKTSLKIAKEVVKSSTRDGTIDKDILMKSVKFLATNNSLKAKQILSAIVKLVKINEKNHTVRIESAFDLNQETIEKLRIDFEKLLSRKLNPVFELNKDLIGGVKITVGDLQWENSIVSNLNYLKENF